MKTKLALSLIKRAALLLLLSTINHQLSTFAQGTAFTYQGRLNDGFNPANGTYNLRFALFDALTVGNQVGSPLTNSPVNVSNGLFTVTLDFGANFPGADRWLEIGVRTNGVGAFSTLSPRQPLTPSPYAIMANSASNLLGVLPAAQLSGTIPSADLSGTYSSPVSFNNGANNFDGNFVGSGSGLFDVWHTAGNFGTTPGVNFLGTTDNQPLIIKVNNQHAQRFEPTTDTPNVVGGYSGNYVQPGLSGVTIGGGGTGLGNQPNLVTNNGYYATIAGGYHNTVTNYGGAILGGSVNLVGGNFGVIGGGQFNTVLGDYSVIGGGEHNLATAGSGVIAGGYSNTNNGSGSFIGAGIYNIVGSSASYAFLGGGVYNNANGTASFIGGGAYHAVSSDYSFIGGGYQNSILTNAFSSVIAGGYGNGIQSSANASFIGAGGGNTIQIGAAQSVIAGGYLNAIQTNSNNSFIGGGVNNTIQAGDYEATIAGGWTNTIQGNNEQSAIGGGLGNTIQFGAAISMIGGGYNNSIQTNAYGAFIGGGYNNINGGYLSTISGGEANAIQFLTDHSTIGGGSHNAANGVYSVTGGGLNNTSAGSWSTVAGGQFNVASNNNATVAGGGYNQALGVSATVGGGFANTAMFNDSVVAGGYQNTASGFRSVISGGWANVISNQYAVIPGGLSNVVQGAYSLAAGQQAQALHPGAFVWSDSQNAPFSSTTNNQFAVRASGGVIFATAGAGLTLDGQPVLTGGVNNLNSALQSFTGGGSNNIILFSAVDSTISGGSQNLIQSNAQYSTISGGYQNVILPNLQFATVGGGANNTNGSIFATIGGGGGNAIGTNSASATIGGGFLHKIGNNTFDATISGGSFHAIGTNSYYTTIGGGHVNSIQDNATASTIGGGYFNAIQTNAVSSTIGGGSNNVILPNALCATVPGGLANYAGGNYSFAAGRRARATNDGCFVWADSTDADFGSSFANEFLIRASFVGIGRASRVTSAEYFGIEAPVGAGAYGGMYIDTTAATGRPFYGYAQAGVATAYHYVDGSDGNKWKLSYGLTVTTGGNVGIGNTSPTDKLMVVNAHCDGATWINASDRNLKTGFAPIEPRTVLERVAALPIQQWSYKDSAHVTHLGPVAQDFKAAFGLGADDTGIATVDESGVALAAIQGLNQKVEEKEARITALENELSEIKHLLTKLADKKD